MHDLVPCLEIDPGRSFADVNVDGLRCGEGGQQAPEISVSCDFCNEAYKISAEEIKELIATATAPAATTDTTPSSSSSSPSSPS